MYHNPITERLFELRSSMDIPQRWSGTPIENFIQAQNFGYPIPSSKEPQLLLATCIEFRYSPTLPSSFAYVVRSPGSRLIGNEFAVGYALARGVRNIVLVGHDDCAMTKVSHFSGPILNALTEQGWKTDKAKEFVEHECERFAIKDELDALKDEYVRLKGIFKKIHVAPLFVRLDEQKVHIPKWYHEMLQTAVV